MELIKNLWQDFFRDNRDSDNWWKRKQNIWAGREAEIIRVGGKGEVFRKLQYDNETQYHYFMHLKYVIKQKRNIHVEEQLIPYRLHLVNGTVTNHEEIPRNKDLKEKGALPEIERKTREQVHERFSYDRLAAVQYAERWWNSRNPDYRVFHVDCTNYVSQCLYAGGAPMWGATVRDRGWWYGSGSWSYSWAVAHSLRWYLSGSVQGLKGKEMESADQLIPGDVICYDFQGDGRWDHNTIVVAKDEYGMPLVNAHTDNSRNRYWSYEDSTAWTPDIAYKFFRIGED
ncbi:amidase domain-containing protein [Oceanobacillus massiliensis]|uniref:amidase domain-containing protein n=1 Tax=Oceanobacillus massiliensis TaxID=1465765 RepID=UPI000287E9F6|nr:amidase domain-containing protein [Oceanobacillus massiliensis]